MKVSQSKLHQFKSVKIILHHSISLPIIHSPNIKYTNVCLLSWFNRNDLHLNRIKKEKKTLFKNIYHRIHEFFSKPCFFMFYSHYFNQNKIISIESRSQKSYFDHFNQKNILAFYFEQRFWPFLFSICGHYIF